MSAAAVPDFVEEFIIEVGCFLRHFNCTLEPCTTPDILVDGTREWRVSGAPMPTFLMVRRSSAAHGASAERYHARARTAVPAKYRPFADKTLDVFNRFATFGAVVQHHDQLEMISQAPLEQSNNFTIAGLMAAALVQGAASVLFAIDPNENLEVASPAQ